jgi:hypothetical protein
VTKFNDKRNGTWLDESERQIKNYHEISYELNHIRFIHLSWKNILINKLIIISEFGLDQLK